MDKLNCSSLYKVFIWDIIIATSVSIIIQLLLGKYFYVIFAGISISYINFIMNDILTGKLMKDCSSTVVVLYIIGVILRILLTALIAFMFFTNNMYSAFLFLLGYCLHFVSLIIISAKVLFAKEGK